MLTKEERSWIENAGLKTEIKRLRKLVVDAYSEGYRTGDSGAPFDYAWAHSYAYEALDFEGCR